VGGDPEHEPFLIYGFEASPDWKALAVVRQGEDGRFGIGIGTPPDWKLKKYLPEPFAWTVFFGWPELHWAPDGRSILLLLITGDQRGVEAWLIPYPADPDRPPRRVLRNLPSYGETRSFSWMPDSRRIVLTIRATPDGSHQLWLADVLSGKRQALTSGTNYRALPAVSPDGQRVVFTEASVNFDVVSAKLDGSPSRELIATERNEMMPSWAAKQPALVYITDRNGPQEIWLRKGDSDRPVVTARSFPPGETTVLMGPALSPNADRVIYERFSGGSARLWISAVSGGAPTPLTDETESEEFATGSWSPDGSWFVYRAMRKGKFALMKVKTTGQAAPITLKANFMAAMPSWSPAGDWIAIGQDLISPDGKTTRPLGNKQSGTICSADGKLVYGVRSEGDAIYCSGGHCQAWRKCWATWKDYSPATLMFSAFLRMERASSTGVSKTKSNLWMLEGFEPKPGLLERFSSR
jgi:Tol biopolymer transport system component